jgi:uncharacterized protein (DUF1499 family)
LNLPRVARRLALGAAVLTGAILIGGCMGLLSGTRPSSLGANGGSLQPVRTQLTNAVSSTATTDYHRIAPLAATPDPKATFARLRTVVTAMPGASIVESTPTYLYAEYTTRWLGFVDDVEFLLDEPAGVIQVRSASRLGRKDFGVNRARIEAVRERLAAR